MNHTANNKGMGSDAERFDMTLQEIADALGLTLGATYQIERRAMQKLRDAGMFDGWQGFTLATSRQVMP